jgi:hypothetical protein
MIPSTFPCAADLVQPVQVKVPGTRDGAGAVQKLQATV